MLRILLIGAVTLAGQATDDKIVDRAVALARTALSRSTGVPSESIALVGVTATEWRDSSLGCPQRGAAYSPVIIAGYLVRLSTGTGQFAVHVGAGRAVVCQAASTVAGAGSKLSSSEAVTGLKRAEEARADLAKTLDVPSASIAIDFFRATMWPDSRLGCAGEAPSPAGSVRGFLIQLSSGGKTYEFHSDATNRPRRCTAKG
jgi:hypothetical protein